MTTSPLPRRVAIIAAVSGLPLAGVALWAAAPNPHAEAVTSGVRTVAVPVQGMMCLSCAARIKQSAKALPGVSKVEVSLAERLVRVTYAANQPSLAPRIVGAINALGYHAGKPEIVR